MERLLRRRSPERLEQPPLPLGRIEPLRPGPDDEAEAPPIINVIWGAYTENIAAGGMTVGDVRRLLRHPHNIPPTATALVNGVEVGARHRLAVGDTLEFARDAGEKGAGHERRRNPNPGEPGNLLRW